MAYAVYVLLKSIHEVMLTDLGVLDCRLCIQTLARQEAHLPYVFSFALPQVCKKVLEGGVASVFPMVLDAAALQVAQLCQCVGLICCVESEVQAGHTKLVCNSHAAHLRHLT